MEKWSSAEEADDEEDTWAFQIALFWKTAKGNVTSMILPANVTEVQPHLVPHEQIAKPSNNREDDDWLYHGIIEECQEFITHQKVI